MKKSWLCLLLVLPVLLIGCAAPKLPRTFDSASEPQPTCGPDGPPWILHNINNLEDLSAFVDAAETPERAEQWIEENWNGSWGMLSGHEEMAALAAELKALPFPSIAAEPEADLQVLPDYGRDYVHIDYENEEMRCIFTIHMNAEKDETIENGRWIKAKNFQTLFDQTKRSLHENTDRYYEGQVDGVWVSVHLMGYNRKEALQFLRELQFENLSKQG